jgi:hypothetical protein
MIRRIPVRIDAKKGRVDRPCCANQDWGECMKKILFSTLLLLVTIMFQVVPVQADLGLSPSGLSVIDAAGNYWYRDIGGTYFGSNYSTAPGSLVSNLNATSYDGKNNWFFASQAQIQGLVSQLKTQIPAAPTGPYDSGNPFTPATYVNGGGHYNWDWSIGPEWEGITDIPAGPGEHMIYTLGFYKIDGQSNSYEYRESYAPGADGVSGPSGSWLVATAGTPPTPAPEPFTLLLLGLGLAGLAGVRRFEK